MLEAESLLLGRKTYEGFSAAWPELDGEFADKMNSMPKYVVSSTLTDPEWHNTTVLSGDVIDEIRKLKANDGGPLLVAGSATLVHALVENDLVDQYRVMVFPVLIADGLRMFPDVTEKKLLQLVDTQTFGSGVAVHTFEPAGS
ncbi:MAG: dihydrofolate reductase family protein [Actinomycetota bacterium]|nr:dihydrofolate reductase family protein [Actinomycetota bacterium]